MNKPMLVSTIASTAVLAYYFLKPMVPQRLRYVLRRGVANLIRRRSTASWPIKPGTERPPANWPGWPGGKQFAIVLTHDVEDQSGLDRCRSLMEMEERHGFHSCFNFIPEGDYSVPQELRQELQQRGFEVGIHDLHHDGSLFRSREIFRNQAEKINGYLNEWQAQGFRAGFMFHNLDWQRDLKVRYDASTFDVDPFEPQPDGVNTIFPFWVEGHQEDAHDSGYVELPYTLVQDSTLFLLLREPTIDLWKRKLDWVAQHGGMVLVNVHPDYMAFNGATLGWNQVPDSFYGELLEYMRSEYGGRYWHALPREVAEYCTAFKPQRPRSQSRHVCMITHSFYESDNRVIRYAEALARCGDVVDVYALRARPDLPREERINGVNVIRVKDRFGKDEKSKWSYFTRLLKFLLIAGWAVSRRHWRRPYELVHAHNVPDFVVFAASLPRLSGARVILDIHDIVPEFFASKFRAKDTSPWVGVLKFVERVSASFAHHVILANHLWVDRYVARSAPRDKCSVFINNVDRTVFRPVPRVAPSETKVIMFPGGLQWHQGLDIAIRAFEKLHSRLPGIEFHIYGDGNMKPELEKLVKDLGLNGSVQFFAPLPLQEIAAAMAHADLGVVPKRADSFGNEAYSTKIMEFMSLGVPVVISNTRIDRYYFNDSVVRFFESGNVEGLTEAMHEVLTNEQLRSEMVARASAYAARHSWERRMNDYLLLVDSLCAVRAR